MSIDPKNFGSFSNNFVGPKGSFKPEIYFIGEAPGAEEDQEGKPFMGPSGRLLDRMCEEAGISLGSCRYFNTVPYRPISIEGSYIRNRTPSEEEIEYYSKEFLFLDLKKFNPKSIVCLGGSAMAPFHLSQENGVGNARQRKFLWNDIPVYVTYHPAYLLRQGGRNSKQYTSVVKDLLKAYETSDYSEDSQKEVNWDIIDIDNVSKLFDLFHGSSMVVLDYETSGLDPGDPSFHIGGLGLYCPEKNYAVYVYLNSFERLYEDKKPPKDKLLILRKFFENKKIIVFNLKYECKVTLTELGISLDDVEDVMPMQVTLLEGGSLKNCAASRLDVSVWNDAIDDWSNLVSELLFNLKPTYTGTVRSELSYVNDNNLPFSYIITYFNNKMISSIVWYLEDMYSQWNNGEICYNKMSPKEKGINLENFFKEEESLVNYLSKCKELVSKPTYHDIVDLLHDDRFIKFSVWSNYILNNRERKVYNATKNFVQLSGRFIEGEQLEVLDRQFTPFIYKRAIDRETYAKFSEAPLKIVAPYCINDIIYTWRLYESFKKDIEGRNLTEALDIYSNHMKLGLEFEISGISWNEEKAKEIEIKYENTAISSLRTLLLLPRMKRILKLSDQSVVNIQSSNSVDSLKEYFNPNSNHASTRDYFSKLLCTPRYKFTMMLYELYQDSLSRGDPEKEMSREYPTLWILLKKLLSLDKDSEKRLQFIQSYVDNSNDIYKTVVMNRSKRGGKYNSEVKLFNKYTDFMLEDLASGTIEDLYNAADIIIGIDIDNNETWFDEFWSVYYFRLFKKVMKSWGTYVNGKCGRGSVVVASTDQVGNRDWKWIRKYKDYSKLNDGEIFISQTNFAVNKAVTKRWTCFSGDTEVLTKEGTIRIRELEGKKVQVLSKYNGELLYREALCQKTGNKKCISIELDTGDKVIVTPEHRFRLRDGTWKEAQLLTELDELDSLNE